MLHSLMIAFAMYSKIPMPKVEWDEKNMRYVMACFPAVGLVIGALEIILTYILDLAETGELMRAVLLAVLPVFVSGGIHLDGFMDTMDAVSSWGDKEKKLAILKDSHTGAFAILSCCVWFLLWTACWSEMRWEMRMPGVMCFVYARILSGLSVTDFPCAKNSGLAATFHNAAHRDAVRRALRIELAVCAFVMILARPVYGIVMLAAGAAVMAYYRHMSLRDFGGITGDLAGFFLCLCELIQLLALLVAGIWF